MRPIGPDWGRRGSDRLCSPPTASTLGGTKGETRMIVTTKELFQQAYGKYAVGAYNINNLEQTVGLFRGNLGKKNSNDEPIDPAEERPFIIQISRGARALYRQAVSGSHDPHGRGRLPEAIFAVHLDHGTEEVCLRLHRQRLLFVGDDRRLARNVRREHRDHAPRGRAGPRKGHLGRGRIGHAGRRRGRHLRLEPTTPA